MFKKQEETQNTFKRDMKDTRQTQIEMLEMKTAIFEIENTLGMNRKQ